MPPLERLCQPGLCIAMADERSVCHWQSNNPPGLGGCGASLKLSMGTLTVHGTRESIPLDAKEGDWLLVRALRSHSDEDGTLRVLSAHISMPTTTTAWLPTALYHREAHMRGLRAPLLKIEPELQLIFTLPRSAIISSMSRRLSG